VPGEGAEGLGVAVSELSHLGGGRVEAGQDEEPQTLKSAQGDLAALNQEGDFDEQRSRRVMREGSADVAGSLPAGVENRSTGWAMSRREEDGQVWQNLRMALSQERSR